MYIGTFPKLNAGSGRVQMPIINDDKHPAAATGHDKLQRTYPLQKGRFYSFINCSGSVWIEIVTEFNRYTASHMTAGIILPMNDQTAYSDGSMRKTHGG